MTGAGRPIRWWPAVAIVAAIGAALLWVWVVKDAGQTQSRVVPTFSIAFFGVLALVLWLVLFSRLAGRLRLGLAIGIGALVALGLLLLEIEGVDGNLVPIVGWRFGDERRFDGRVAGAAETQPGPHDYPQLYGPERRASLDGPRLEADWSSHPPRELWRREVGEACSSFAVAGEAAVTHELRGDDEVIVRYELRTGRQVWLHAVRAPFRTTVGGSGPRATPTIAGAHVFALGATGRLTCVGLADGREVWSRNILEDHGADQPDWGTASSPLVVGDRVLVQLGNRGEGTAAYDRATGEPAWRVGDDAGTYTSPLLATVGGIEQVLVVYRDSVAGHDPSNGEILWRHAWPRLGERVSLPLVIDEHRLLVSAGYGQGSRMLSLSRGAAGLEAELVWESRRLKSKFASMVYHDGTVFGLDDGVLVALDPATGERRWKRGRYGHGQIVRVGDLLLIQCENGDVVLVAADPAEHRELARLAALDGRTWNPPALSGRVLLVRNDREAAAFELPLAAATDQSASERSPSTSHTR